MGLCPVSWSLVTSNPSKASALPCLGPSLRQSLWGLRKGFPDKSLCSAPSPKGCTAVPDAHASLPKQKDLLGSIRGNGMFLAFL